MDYREDPSGYGYGYHAYGARIGTPRVLLALIVLNGAIWFLQFIVNLFFGQGVTEGALRILGLYYPRAIGTGFIWQFITYAFLHDPGSIHHVLFNMLFLWMFGREVVAVLGRRRFLIFYFTAAVFAGLLFVGFDLAKTILARRPALPCVGASGVVMAVIMLYALYFPNRTVLFMFFIPMRVRTFVFIVIIFELFGVLDLNSNVANSAHLGGLLWGVLFLRYGTRIESLLSRPSRPRPAPTADDERRLDAILDKIHREGMNSLTWGERRFLRKMARRQ